MTKRLIEWFFSFPCRGIPHGSVGIVFQTAGLLRRRNAKGCRCYYVGSASGVPRKLPTCRAAEVGSTEPGADIRASDSRWD
jgi:hypothetical protein